MLCCFKKTSIRLSTTHLVQDAETHSSRRIDVRVEEVGSEFALHTKSRASDSNVEQYMESHKHCRVPGLVCVS